MFLLPVVVAIAGVSPVERLSETQWIYAPPADNPPSNACLRLVFDVPKPVKSAFAYMQLEKATGQWFDGRPFLLKPWPLPANVPAALNVDGIDLKPRLSQGRHVLAFSLERDQEECYGMILRGEIVFEDGERCDLLSCARQFKASGEVVPGWMEPDFDDASWKPAIELGDPCIQRHEVHTFKRPWVKCGEMMRLFASSKECARYEELVKTGGMSPEQERQLLAEPDRPNVRIVYAGDTPGIEVNGKVFPPYVHSHMDMAAMPARERYFCHLRDIGMNMFTVKVFRHCVCEPEEGHYDFTYVENCIRRMLALHPGAYFLLSYSLGKGLPEGWEDRNPDELVGYAVPSENMNPSAYVTNARVPSFASQAFRDLERRFWKAFGDYANSKPWGRRIIGIHCGFGGSGDGMPTGAHCMPDTGKRMTETFRRYLQEKYATDADLQRAWSDTSVTRATAVVPDRVVRKGSGGYLRDLSDPRDRRVADYYDCYHKTFEEFILDYAASVKAGFPGRIVGAYHGYSVLSYAPEGNTSRICRLLRSKDFDFFYATTCGYNLSDGLHRSVASICHRYGKLTSIEGDVRTHVAQPSMRPSEGYHKWRCKTPEETRATFAKIVANALVRGTGWHMVDFGVYTARATPWFDIPEALEPFATSVREWRRAWDNPVRTRNEVAIVLDLEQLWKQGSPVFLDSYKMTHNLNTYPLQALNFTGIPYDLLTPEGYLAAKDRYKAVVFLNLYETTSAVRRQVRAKLAVDGATAMWCFASGLADATGFSTSAMRELTGMDLGFERAAHTYGMLDKDGEKTALVNARENWKYSPRVFSRDAAGEVFATWQDDGTAAIARKRLADGSTSVFMGMTLRNSAKWAKLLTDAGCRAVTKPGFMVRRGNGYLEVFSGKNMSIPPESLILTGQIDQSGRVEVHPVKNATTLTDVFSGEVYEVRNGTMTLTADNPRTWLFREE